MAADAKMEDTLSTSEFDTQYWFESVWNKASGDLATALTLLASQLANSLNGLPKSVHPYAEWSSMGHKRYGGRVEKNLKIIGPPGCPRLAFDVFVELQRLSHPNSCIAMTPTWQHDRLESRLLVFSIPELIDNKEIIAAPVLETTVAAHKL